MHTTLAYLRYSGKLSREKIFANFELVYPQKFSPRNRRPHPHITGGAIAIHESFLCESSSPVRESFLPRKFPAKKFRT